MSFLLWHLLHFPWACHHFRKGFVHTRSSIHSNLHSGKSLASSDKSSKLSWINGRKCCGIHHKDFDLLATTSLNLLPLLHWRAFLTRKPHADKQLRCSPPEPGKSWMWLNSLALWCDHHSFPAGIDCWELNCFGVWVVLVRTVWSKHMDHIWGSWRCLAYLLVFFVTPQNFCFLELAGFRLKRVWLQHLQPEIRSGWTKEAKRTRVWVENYSF